MAQLPIYNRQYGFIAFQQSNPSDPLPADKVEIEYNAIKTVLDAARANLMLIQRDDGALANESVGNDQLEVSLRTGINPPTTWAAGTAYSVNDTVVYTDGSRSELWLITEAHTSSSAFDDDSAKMRKLADWLDVLGAASAVTYDNTASGLAATDVKAAIDEIDAALDALTAASVAYDNSSSGLTATDVNAAIDEVSGQTKEVVDDTTPQLGGALDVNGKKIVSSTNGNVEIDPHGTGDIVLGAETVTVEKDIVHAGDTDTMFRFGTDTVDLRTGGSSRLDISNSGVRLSGANAVINEFSVDGTLAGDSDSAVPTEKAVKTYVDAQDHAEGLQADTATATTSGTTHDITGIPAGINQITVMLDGVSLSGTDEMRLVLGDSGGLETTGYNGFADRIGNTPAAHSGGFYLTVANAAARLWYGAVTLSRVDGPGGNTWAVHGCITADSSGLMVVIAGSKELSGELTQLRLENDGADTFDAGQFNILYQ